MIALATEPATDFDHGPLSWVQSEIDQSLARALDALAALRSAPADRSHVKHARAHVHQAAGAIQMVGLDAIVAFTDEIERQLARFEDLAATEMSPDLDLVERACTKLRIFLDEVVGGIAPVPLRLYPEYEAMQRARGVRASSPTDLFYPDLSARAPRSVPKEGIPASRLAAHLVRQRRQFQRGLLGWLRGEPSGASVMREAVGGIEDATSQSSLRSFWWTVGALVDAMGGGGVDPGFGVKQLAARVDLQIRRVAEGSAKVADRLRREVLYYVAISAPVSPQVQAVQRAYGLGALIPSVESAGTDVLELRPRLREAREQLAGAKDTWLKFASGRAENLPKLKQTLASVHAKAVEIRHGALSKLTSALAERLEKMPSGGVSEPVAMEYATAILLAESAFENYSNLAADFPHQVDQMIARLDAARSGRAPAGGGAPMLDEMSERAQERVLIAQVGREIQANLRHMEQVLDAFFRDHGKRADLASLRKDSDQVRGALSILGLDDAERLLGMCQAQIEAYLDPDAPVGDDDLELLAESLSGLGFYVEAVEQQRPERDGLIAPLIAKRLGEPAADLPGPSDSVEDAIDELRAALPGLLVEVESAPADETARSELRRKLAALRDDAELIGDGELVAQAAEALKAFDASGTSASLAAAVEAIADTGAEVPEISAETQRLLEVDASGLDAELLEIYLAEAAEVLDSIRAHLALLDGNRGDRDALGTVRRGFHTLKGSGRMVGLADLGEYAYDVEKIHNRLLDEERPVTAAVLAMIRAAEATFRDWVGTLSSQGRVTPDPSALHAAIRAVEAELPGSESVIGPLPLAEPPQVDVPVLSIVSPAPAAVEIEVAAVVVEVPEAEAEEAANAPTLDVAASGRDAGVAELAELGAETVEAWPAVDIEAGESGLSESGLHVLDDGMHVDESAEQLPVTGVTLKLVADNTRPAASAPFAGAAHLHVATPLPGVHDREGEHEHGLLPAIELVEDEGAPPVDVDSAAPIVGAIDAPGDFDDEVGALASNADAADSSSTVEIEFEADAIDVGDAQATAPLRDESGPATVLDGEFDAAADAPVDIADVAEVGEPPAPYAGDDLAVAATIELEATASAGEGPDGFDAPVEGAPEEIAVGPVSLSASLWRILVDEAAQHLGTLEHELALLQFDPSAGPSQSMIRAAHTLCGIHRTGGFDTIATLAKSLELALIAVSQTAVRPATALPVFAGAVAALRGLAASIEARAAFCAEDEDAARDSQVELDALRLVAAHDAALDAEAAAEHEARSEDEVESPAPDAATVAEPVIVIPPAPVDPLANVRDEVEDAEVLAIFLDEAAELFPAAGDQLRRWHRAPQDATSALDLRRTLHTFKGSARMAGAMRLGELTHLMESRLLDGEAPAEGTPELYEALETDLDRIAFVLDRLRAGETNVALPWLAACVDEPATEEVAAAMVATAAASDDAPNAGEVQEDVAAPGPAVVAEVTTEVTTEVANEVATEVAATEPARVPESSVAQTPGPSPAAVDGIDTQGEAPEVAPTAAIVDAGSPEAPPPAVQPSLPVAPAGRSGRAAGADGEAGPRAMLRVRADTIDRLVNEAGEVAIARARIEGELRALKTNLLELTSSVIRLRTQVREIEIQAESQIQSRMTQMHEGSDDFDPLEFDRYTRFQELTRSLAEGVNDVSTVQQSLLRNLDDADAALLAQSRLSREMQQKLFGIRTVPFSSLSERLYRIVRQVARELGKRANLEIAGAQTELDRSVLEKLAGPLEHLLRNALDHGIEGRDARRAVGKAETGEISLSVRQSGNEIVIELADDGAGIDAARVHEKAIALGILSGDASPTEQQILDCIFRPGFSTASRVTAISGRGVGMDVVRAELAGLGGRVEVGTEAGRGTRFTLALPLTLAVAQAVLVRAGGRQWAFPAHMVEQVQQVREEALYSLYVERKVEWLGRRYPFHYLPRLLGDAAHHPENRRYNSVLLLKSGQGVCAVHVDEMVGKQEIVVKNVGPQLARVPGIAGATVLGTGEIVLIINPVQLAHRPGVPALEPDGATRVVAPVARVSEGPPLVMIVDDSLTVRRITSRLLVREGFRVVTAKDGLDALQELAKDAPDVILLDIEMPRMDGFEFTKTIKGDPKFARIPIVMITSRTADKHRARATELGVDLYLGKPYQEDELLGNLREMLGVAAAT